MRTPEEIVAYIKADESKIFGFAQDACLPFLPFEVAKQFLKDGVTTQEWAEMAKPLTQEAVLAGVKEYMGFALEKCLDHRGLSANRSVQKMEAWMWLIGNDEIVTFINTAGNYKNYGEPILKKVC